MFSYEQLTAASRATAPRASSPAAASATSAAEKPWVTVTWMPHSSLSQSSHVQLGICSVHAILDNASTAVLAAAGGGVPDEWRVNVSIFGMGGLPLVPIGVSSSTTAAPLLSRTGAAQHQQEEKQQNKLHPSVLHATHDCNVDQVLQIPIRWRDLPRDAYIEIQVVERGDNVAFEATMPLFDSFGRLQTGLHRLELKTPSSSEVYSPINPNSGNGDDEGSNDYPRNPGLAVPSNDCGRRCQPHLGQQHQDDDSVFKASCILQQLESFAEARSSSVSARKHDGSGLRRSDERTTQSSSVVTTATKEEALAFGDIPSVPWLDALTREHCERVLRSNAAPTADASRTSLLLSTGETKSACIILDLPKFDVPIIHEETHYPIPTDSASGPVTALDIAQYRKARSQRQPQQIDDATTKTATADDSSSQHLALVPFLDYESELDNPVEDKYRTLAHDLLRGLVDPALKPDREQRDRLAAIIASPSHHPTREEKDLLWRFRFSLVDNRRALTKFLVAVDWTVESEVVQAAELLEQWRKRSPIEVTDALKLLGKHVAFQTSLVREYAIDTLASAPDAELRLYLLQLVQAIKYENTESFSSGLSSPVGHSGHANETGSVSSLATFLIERASKNIELANYLYWYIKVELEDPTYGIRYRDVFRALQQRLSNASFEEACLPSDAQRSSTNEKDGGRSAAFKSIVDSVSKKLASSRRHSENGLADGGDKTKRGRKRVQSVWDMLVTQDRFISGIMDIQLKSRHARGKGGAKEMHLKELLRVECFDRYRGVHPVPLPSAPHVMVNGVNPQSAKVFKSALYPALIEFHVDSCINHEAATYQTAAARQHASTPISQMSAEQQSDSSEGSRRAGCFSSYKVIVKTGDDLRQDQLVIMMIQLMDGLLKRGSLDLCLRPYSIIAMSPNSGLVEFVDKSMPISQVLANYGNSILQFFRAVAPKRAAKYDVAPDVMTTYVRSCAGYCVITYILGVGDRHLDNIMLQSSGHFFHIDFGFIFGRDPKPLPPAFRLTREMVDGMGGLESSEYRQFCSLACQAFNTLRKSAGLILNLLHLMGDAGIEDLSNNPVADAEGVISKVEERFKLELTDEQAERFFLGLINDTLAAFAPRVMDVFHSLAVARR